MVVGKAWPASWVAARQEKAIAKHVAWQASALPWVSLSSFISMYTHAVASRNGTDIIKPEKNNSFCFYAEFFLSYCMAKQRHILVISLYSAAI